MKPIKTVENFGLIAELYEDGSVDIKQHVGHGTYLRMHITDLATLSGLVRKVQDAWLEIKRAQNQLAVPPGLVEGPTMGCKPPPFFEPSFVSNPHTLKPIIDLDPTAPPMKITAHTERLERMLAERGPLPKETFKRVGFWKNTCRERDMMDEFCSFMGVRKTTSTNDEYPDVRDFIDPNWKRDKPEEYSAVVAYLAVGAMKDAYKGSSECRICKQSNGSCDMTEGPWVWPEGFVHYITAHHVKPPQEFIDYIVKWMAEVK